MKWTASFPVPQFISLANLFPILHGKFVFQFSLKLLIFTTINIPDDFAISSNKFPLLISPYLFRDTLMHFALKKSALTYRMSN